MALATTGVGDGLAGEVGRSGTGSPGSKIDFDGSLKGTLPALSGGGGSPTVGGAGGAGGGDGLLMATG